MPTITTKKRKPGRPRNDEQADDASPFALALGREIRRLRERKKLSVPELARRAGLPPTRIYALENAARTGGFDGIVQIAAALDVSLARFNHLKDFYTK